MKYVYIFFVIVLLLQPTSQILEKIGMTKVGKITTFGELLNIGTIIRIISNPYVIVGLCLALISLLFWLATLSSWNISYLYPLGSSLSQIILVTISVLFLHESMSVERWMGVVVIAAGCVLLNWK
jgi:uncharacterized membrane protein